MGKLKKKHIWRMKQMLAELKEQGFEISTEPNPFHRMMMGENVELPEGHHIIAYGSSIGLDDAETNKKQ